MLFMETRVLREVKQILIYFQGKNNYVHIIKVFLKYTFILYAVLSNEILL